MREVTQKQLLPFQALKDRSPILRGTLAGRAAAVRGVAIKAITLIPKHLRVRLPSRPKAPVREGILVADGDQVAHAVIGKDQPRYRGPFLRFNSASQIISQGRHSSTNSRTGLPLCFGTLPKKEMRSPESSLAEFTYSSQKPLVETARSSGFARSWERPFVAFHRQTSRRNRFSLL